MQELPASLDLEERRLSANSYGGQPGSAGGSYPPQGASPYSDAGGVFDGQRAFSGGMSELDRATLERYALAQGFEGPSHSNGAPAQVPGPTTAPSPQLEVWVEVQLCMGHDARVLL